MGIDVQAQMEEIRAELEALPGKENKLSMIVFSRGLDKHLAAMIIATGAAAMGMKVVLFFTFWGTAALRDPKARRVRKGLIGRMFGFMLPRGRDKLVLS